MRIPELEIDLEDEESERYKSIDSWFSELNKQNKFNGVVLIRSKGETKISKGYGFADHRKEHKLTSTTSVRIASLSKQYTAVGVMILHNLNKLNYDDLIRIYIPELPYENVTIRNLLNQTSGIPDIYIELAEKEKDEIGQLTIRKAIQLLVKEKRNLVSIPNERFQYSNTNYLLLAGIIEKITDQTFESFMKKEVFDPLGMKNTRVWNLLSKEIDNINRAEDLEIANKILIEIKPDFLDGVAGDGGIFTSLNDLEIWDEFWDGKHILNKVQISEAFKENSLNSGEISKYGFGWMLTKTGMWHNGAWLGARSIFIRNTENESCFAIIDNASNLYFDKILDEIEKIEMK